MAGSLKWFNYISNSGTTFALFGDESNIEAVNGTASAWTSGTTFGIPRNLRPRYATYRNTAGTRSIRVPVLATSTFNDLPASITDPIEGGTTTLFLRRPSPEKFTRYPTANDTGLNDGDSP